MSSSSWLTWSQRKAIEKRSQTIAARKADTGCTCHGRDLALCPNYRIEPAAAFRNRVTAHKWAV